MDAIAREVCQAYAEMQAGFQLYPLGNRGGFSGARLWRVETFCGKYCLRAWPLGTDINQVQASHWLLHLAERAALPFTPRLLATLDGSTRVRMAGRYGELTTWLPGVADFHQHPTRTRLHAALQALARLHRVCESPPAIVRPCPAIEKRLAKLREWQSIDRNIVPSLIRQTGSGTVGAWALRSWEQFQRWSPAALTVLAEWQDFRLPLHDCLCDIWHDHVLFEDQELTGIVDYGSVRMDSVATDLARLIGSLVGDDVLLRSYALEAYEAYRPLSFAERRLVRVLDWTGVVVGAANWLRWLYLERRQFENTEGVAKRLSELVTRMESWTNQAQGQQPVSLE
jgi:Ser/Thr protein kinase RdoA (MazF antagonist)